MATKTSKKEIKKNEEKKIEIKNDNKRPPLNQAIIISIIAICIASFSIIKETNLYRELVIEKIKAEDNAYSVYIGLTDKNQNRQVIEEDVAIELIKTICIHNSTAYTIYKAQGGFKKEGIIHTEKTLLLELNRVSKETLEIIMNDIKRRLNVGTLLVVKKKVEMYDY